jgi:hypothetical protein
MSNCFPTHDEVIALVEKLNAEVYEIIGYGCFGYHTDGTCQAICIDDYSLWDDNEDPRKYIDEEDDYEPLEPFVRKAAKEYAGRIILGLEQVKHDNERSGERSHDAPAEA